MAFSDYIQRNDATHSSVAVYFLIEYQVNKKMPQIHQTRRIALINQFKSCTLMTALFTFRISGFVCLKSPATLKPSNGRRPHHMSSYFNQTTIQMANDYQLPASRTKCFKCTPLFRATTADNHVPPKNVQNGCLSLRCRLNYSHHEVRVGIRVASGLNAYFPW